MWRSRDAVPESRPPFSCSEAERLVRERYGIEGQATELVAEFDRNFLIEVDRDDRFVLFGLLGTGKHLQCAFSKTYLATDDDRELKTAASGAVPAPELPYLPPEPRSYRPPIGLIGCGIMGTAMATRLQEAGYEIVAFDVDVAAPQAPPGPHAREGFATAFGTEAQRRCRLQCTLTGIRSFSRASAKASRRPRTSASRCPSSSWTE